MAITVKPSRRFRQFVAQYDTTRLAARDLKIEPLVLDRFLGGEGGLSMRTIAQIIEATGMDYDVLFEHVSEK